MKEALELLSFHKKIDQSHVKETLISVFLKSVHGISMNWENQPRGEKKAPCLWSGLLDTREDVDAVVKELKQYAFEVISIASERTPGKFRVGIRLNSILFEPHASLISLSDLYIKKLSHMIGLFNETFKQLSIKNIESCAVGLSHDHFQEFYDASADQLAKFKYKDVIFNVALHSASQFMLQMNGEFNESLEDSKIPKQLFHALLVQAGIPKPDEIPGYENASQYFIDCAHFHSGKYDASYVIWPFSYFSTLCNIVDAIEYQKQNQLNPKSALDIFRDIFGSQPEQAPQLTEENPPTPGDAVSHKREERNQTLEDEIDLEDMQSAPQMRRLG